MPWRAALIGYGQIGGKYSHDLRMARHYRFSSHAQVLQEHPEYSWEVLIDTDTDALAQARSDWDVAHALSSINDLDKASDIDVVIFATAPDVRLEYLNRFPKLKAVIVEKPLGDTLSDARHFAKTCKERNIAVQVNLLRRADPSMRKLADGGLKVLIGELQSGSIFYGNGMRNNGIHMIDLVRMLLGEIESVSAMSIPLPFREGPLKADLNFATILNLKNQRSVMMQPLRFQFYRENSLDLWGTGGRLAITQEGLRTLVFRTTENRALSGAQELDSETPEIRTTGISDALYALYSNLHAHLAFNAPLDSGISSALMSEKVVESCFESLSRNGERITCY